jgi:hypothetical protein
MSDEALLQYAQDWSGRRSWRGEASLAPSHSSAIFQGNRGLPGSSGPVLEPEACLYLHLISSKSYPMIIDAITVVFSHVNSETCVPSMVLLSKRLSSSYSLFKFPLGSDGWTRSELFSRMQKLTSLHRRLTFPFPNYRFIEPSPSALHTFIYLFITRTHTPISRRLWKGFPTYEWSGIHDIWSRTRH